MVRVAPMVTILLRTTVNSGCNDRAQMMLPDLAVESESSEHEREKAPVYGDAEPYRQLKLSLGVR